MTVDRPVSDRHLQRLRQGLVITTDTVRQGRHRSLTAKTLPCQVERIAVGSVTNIIDRRQKQQQSYCSLQMTLTEGRNRQIRKMLQTLGYTVLDLHRTHFLDINLRGLSRPGDWTRLTGPERSILLDAVQRAAAAEAAKQ